MFIFLICRFAVKPQHNID